MAALRKDPQLTHVTYECVRLPDGRVGNYIKGSNRPIRDDLKDQTPHGSVDMERGIVVSCNAYFAQLGTYDVGAEPLFETANLLGIAAASPNTAAQLKKSLPQASYGQGQVVASPFQMARVAATVANGGAMPQGRWIADETNARTSQPQPVIGPDTATVLAQYMREVVTGGTGRAAAASVPVAGKTGHRGVGGRAVARVVHRLRAVWRRARARSHFPSWWRMECTAARPPRPRHRRSWMPP